MTPLFYLMKKTFKNYLKDLKRKPFALIGYIVIAALIIGAIVMNSINPSQRHTYLSNYRFGFIVGMVLLIFFYLSMKDGLAKGSSFFRLSDVNLVFTAPISPKKVLVYGIFKQLYRTFIMLFFIVCQIPNMANWFKLKSYASIVLILGVFVFMFSMSIIGILVYSIASRSEKSRDMFDKGLKVVAIIFIGIGLTQVMKTKNIILAGEAIFNSSYFSYIPIVGWTKEILMACVYGISTSFYIYFVITIIFIGVMIYIIYNVNTDYYEDVLGATEYKEQLLKNAREGKSARFNTKLRKIKQSYKGNGAKAIFYRQMLEYRKSGFFFINMRTLIMIIAGIFFGMSIGKNNIMAVLYFSVYMLLIFSFQGKWSDEIQKQYIFLIPSSSFSKVFYATLADHIKNFIDGIVLFIVVGIKFKTSPLIIFLCALAYTSFGAIYIYIDILARRIFKIESKTLETFFKFIFAILIVAPGISISVYLAIAHRDITYMKYLMYLILIGYNLCISTVILMFNKAIFENLEMH